MKRWLHGGWLLLALVPICGSAQRVENLRASFEAGKVTVLYDITGGHERQTYHIELLSSHNGFTTPLRLVTGDVGDEVSGGRDRRIVWDAAQELGTFSGDITFRINGSLIPMKLLVKNPVAGATVRRGQNTLVQWEGGVPDHNVRIELYQGNNRIAGFGEAPNNGNHSLKLPKNLSKGNYHFRLSADSETARSGDFAVKPMVGMGLKILPAVLGAGVVVWLLLQDDAPAVEKLPVAPVPQ